VAALAVRLEQGERERMRRVSRRRDGEVMPLEVRVLFFDGVCGLCNAAVDFVMARDRAGKFKFSPLQSAFAARKLGSQRIKDLDTAVLLDGAAVYERSDAILHSLIHLGGAWRIAGFALLIFPRGLRDVVYRIVAANRLRWFGKRETCRLPTPAERARFILD
jgi:predicted DCC family thiol-disulfide oxidoreductase YuxK